MDDRKLFYNGLLMKLSDYLGFDTSDAVVDVENDELTFNGDVGAENQAFFQMKGLVESILNRTESNRIVIKISVDLEEIS